MNKSGSKTPTAFIPLIQFMITEADDEVSKLCTVPCTIQCYDHSVYVTKKKKTF